MSLCRATCYPVKKKRTKKNKRVRFNNTTMSSPPTEERGGGDDVHDECVHVVAFIILTKSETIAELCRFSPEVM